MSSFGVTHFIEGQPNFTDLERWQWEHRIFMKMLQLKVFRKYRVWKVPPPPWVVVSVRACDVWCLFVRACDVWCLTYRRALACVPNLDGTPHAARLTVLPIFPNGVEQSLLVWKNVVHYGKMSKHKGLLVKHLFWMDPIARTVRVFACAQSH